MATTPACFPSFRLWARFQARYGFCLRVCASCFNVEPRPLPQGPHPQSQAVHNPSGHKVGEAKFVPGNLPNLTNLDTAWPMICTWAPSTWPLALLRDGRKWDRSGSSINMGS
ncbi:hypothetical protein CDEST_13475 [Colletotrichum destructivum]|uniref:Uncharacterized protein n=1 Tax=Colletotrichum destructivum TaxID=34406 RepID=A0AAX4IZD1_9PEZI|nr:hypothetical protein CDEST_13475 [Colletotrichum destructivum]